MKYEKFLSRYAENLCIIWIKKVVKKLIHYYWYARASFHHQKSSNSVHPIVIFFLPEAAIQSFINTMLVVALQLKNMGHRVVFIRCFSVLERCVYMDSVNFNNETKFSKKELCTQCFSSFQKKIIDLGFDYFDLRNFVKPNDHVEINDIISKNPKEVFSYEKDEIQFTELLKYNFFLYNKSTNLTSLDASKLKLWQDSLRSLYIGYKSFSRMTEIKKISHVFMIDEYSFNLVVKKIANKKNIIFKSLSSTYHKDVTAEKVRVFNRDTLSDLYYIRDNWPHCRELKLDPFEIKDITDDLICKMSKKGTYTYSPTKENIKDIHTLLELSRYKKTIVAYTSSPDEVEALLTVNKKVLSRNTIFKDAFSSQLDWLIHLAKFVQSRDDLQLIIRIHPRMASNHREKIRCDALDEFKDKLNFNVDNIKIIWPEVKISSYDIAEIADLVTVAWSSMGIDIARLSIPVISGFTNSIPLPNDIFHLTISDKASYFEKILELVNKKSDLQSTILAYRWYKAAYLNHSIDLSDIFNSTLNGKISLSKNAHMLEKALINNENVFQNNIDLDRAQIKHEDLIKEHDELKRQLGRVIYFLITNIDYFFENCSMMKIENFLDSLSVDENRIHYLSDEGVEYVKYSPLISRLYTMLTNEINLEYKKCTLATSSL